MKGLRIAAISPRGIATTHSTGAALRHAANGIDNRKPLALVAGVVALRRIALWLLLALWLPVTQHCVLEAAGVLENASTHEAQSHCCETPSKCCDADGCQIVEGELTKPATATVKLPTPAFITCLCLVCVTVPVDPSIEKSLLASTSDDPVDWVPAWQFVRRAAPFSRAPSLLS